VSLRSINSESAFFLVSWTSSMSNRVAIDPKRSPQYSYPWIPFNPSPRTTLGWPKSSIVTRFFATTTCTTISGHPRHKVYNIPYHGTHVVEYVYNLLHLSKAVTPYSPPILRQSESLWIPIHVNNLQNKSCIPLSSPYALDLKMGFKLRRNLLSIGWDGLNMSNEGLLRRRCIMGFLSGSIM
jgi:hypothetical protein